MDRIYAIFLLPMKNILSKIIQKPPAAEYIKGYTLQQVKFIKSRIRLLCIITVSFYVFTAILDAFINPDNPLKFELIAGSVLFAGAFITLFFNKKIHTLMGAKGNAHFFIVVMLVLMVRLGIDYAETPAAAAAIYGFSLFLVSLTIPWTAIEVLPLFAMHIMAFSAECAYIHKYGSRSIIEMYTLEHSLEALIFLFMVFVLCVVIRRKETGRDILNYVLFTKVEEKNKQMNKELQWATRVHKTIIPDSMANDKVEIGVYYRPAYYIGGDYVKFEFIDEDKLIFIMSDVTGHGVPAALLVNRMHAEFMRLAREGKSPGVLLKNLNDFIKEDFDGSDMYLSAFCGLLNMKEMTLEYSNYGHLPQYVYSEPQGKIYSMPAQTSLLGLPIEDNKVYQDRIDMDTGDRILLFTDGITETTDKDKEEFGQDRVAAFLEENHSMGCDLFNSRLLEELEKFKEGNFKDDICMLGIDIKCHESLLSRGSKLFRPHQK